MKKRKVALQKQVSTKKISRLVYWFSIIFALIIGAAGGSILVAVKVQKQLATNNQIQKISAVYEALATSYYKKVSKKDLTKGAISGMLTSLNDPYSQFLDTEATTNLNESVSGSFVGIGAEVRKTDQAIEIVAPIKGAPAQKAGLLANDLIIEINGKSTAKMTVNQAVSKIRGEKGTTVKLTIKRGKTSFKVQVKRSAVDQATVTGSLSEKNSSIGLISISTFAENTASGMKKVIKHLRKQGAKKFVIDVRGNPGGLMNAALSLSSMFLKDGQVIMRTQERNGSNKTVYRASSEYDKGFKVTEPCAILVDGNSASAAEIFSAALQESGKQLLVGTKTFGKGTVQSVIGLNDTSEMKFTTAKWLTPNSTWINKTGITPNIKADYPAIANLTIISSNQTLKLGDVSEQVKLLQQNLDGLGYQLTNTKGIYDSATVQAVKKLQTSAGLTITGSFDDQTRLALYQQVASYIQQNDQALSAAITALTTEVDK